MAPLTYDDLADVVAVRLADRSQLIGISGAVAVGKSTISRELAVRLRDRGRTVDVVATDGFLHPNAVLAERDLLSRKGFPESFDAGALRVFCAAVKDGAASVNVPAYSHVVYDVDPDGTFVLEHPDVVVLEGVVALQPPAVDLLDVAVYVDAAEDDVRRWFTDRFLALTAEAEDDPASFYRMFAGMDEAQVRSVAEGTWDGINGPNLRAHIAPSRARAAIVVRKAADHTIEDIAVTDGR